MQTFPKLTHFCWALGNTWYCHLLFICLHVSCLCLPHHYNESSSFTADPQGRHSTGTYRRCTHKSWVSGRCQLCHTQGLLEITSKGQSTCNWPCIYIAYFRVSLWHQHNPGYKSLSGLWNALHFQLWTQKLSRPTHTLLFWNISTMISSKGNNGIKFWPKLIFPVRFTMLNILRSQPQKQNQTPQN